MSKVSRKQERKVTRFWQNHANNVIGVMTQLVVFLLFIVVIQHRDFVFSDSERKRLEGELASMKILVENDPAPSWLKEVIEASDGADISFKMMYINPAYEDAYQITNEYYSGKTDFDVWDSRIASNFYINDLTTYTTNKNGCYEEVVPNTVDQSEGKKRISCKWLVNKSDGTTYVAGRVVEFSRTKEKP